MPARDARSISRHSSAKRTQDMEDKPPALWSPEALADIDHIWDYYAEVAGRSVADNLLRDIAKVVHTLSEYAMAGRSRDEVRAGLRSISATPHVVFYRLRGEQPEIVRCSTDSRISTRYSPERRTVDVARVLFLNEPVILGLCHRSGCPPMSSPGSRIDLPHAPCGTSSRKPVMLRIRPFFSTAKSVPLIGLSTPSGPSPQRKRR